MKTPAKTLDVSPFYGKKIAGLPPWKRSAVSVMPLHVLYQLRTELQLAWVRLTSLTVARRYRGATNLKVNVGSGSRGHPDWVNVDFLAMPSVNCVCDCRKVLPFPDNSVRLIFTEHFFEHIDYTEEAPLFLSECLRVLQPGGIIRIIVPDAERYLRAYCEPGWDAMTRLRLLKPDHFDGYTDCTYRTKMELVNEVFRQAYTHKFAYDHETVERLLADVGFGQIVHQEFGKSLDPELAIDLKDRAHESLYVEGVKRG